MLVQHDTYYYEFIHDDQQKMENVILKLVQNDICADEYRRKAPKI